MRGSEGRWDYLELIHGHERQALEQENLMIGFTGGLCVEAGSTQACAQDI